MPGATLTCARSSAKKTREPLITVREAAEQAVKEILCHVNQKIDMPIETAIMPTPYEFNTLKLAAQAEKKLKTETAMAYEVHVPCCACMNCVIVRIFAHGRVYDESYNCIYSRRRVDRFGHCRNGKEGLGPNVIVVNPKLELLAERTSKGEIKEFEQKVTEVPNIRIEDLQKQPKMEATNKPTKENKNVKKETN